jgi:transcriptional regulator with XRE-family HTH domain
VAEPTPEREGERQSLPIGEQLRQLREARGWSLGDVRRLTGISGPHLSRVERGEAVPSADKLTAIRDAFGPDADELLDKLEAAGLVERLGFDPVAAEVAVTAKRLDLGRRIQLLDTMRGMLDDLDAREPGEVAQPEAPEPGEGTQR